MSTKSGNKKGRGDNATDWGGLDPAVLKSIVRKIPPNPVTGRVELTDVMDYMASHPDEMEVVMSMMDRASGSAPSVDLEKFDYASLTKTIKPSSFWVIQLESMGVVDSTGRMVKEGKEHTTPGARSMFTIYCYDDKHAFRVMHQCDGLPNADDLLTAVRAAIAQPIPPLRPSLPELFIVSSKLAPHLASAKPLLDSLPSPFTWRVETATEAEQVATGIQGMNDKGVKECRRLGAEAKKAGNEAFAKKDRNLAVDAYAKAIRLYINALSQRPDVEDKKDSERQLAICYANRAASWLIEGAGMDEKKALGDGQGAEDADPTYAKGYFRQATAYEKLGNKKEASYAIRRALERPELENDKALVDRLIELLTNGKGLSNNEAEFKQWMLDVGTNDGPEGAKLLSLKGEWKKRLDEKFARWQSH